MSRKQTFPCGHTGKGRFCHRCEKDRRDSSDGFTPSAGSGVADPKSESSGPHSVKEPDKVDLDKMDKEAWRETFEADVIPLRHLPSKGLVQRARMILEEIQKGAPWHQFNGKRLQHDRTIVSVPLGRRYRILFRTDEGAPRPVEVLSHESYNGTKPGRR
jgi:hypothetical protein